MEIAKKLLILDIKTIVEKTGLTIKEVEQLGWRQGEVYCLQSHEPR